MGLKRIAFAFLSLALVLAGSLAARAEVSQATVDYLAESSQNQWVTQALSAAGAVEFDLAYLDEFEGANANDFAKTILAVAAAGLDPHDFNGQDLVEGLLAYHNNRQLGAANLLNDDIWGIMALRSAGEAINSQAVQDAKDYLLANQNDDGGWNYSPEGTSDTNDTASAVMALLDAGLTAQSAEIIAALAYLEGSQNNDGGFGFYENSESDSGSSAWVMAALTKSGIEPATWEAGGNNVIEYLESLRLEDGSYKWVSGDDEGSLLMTAYAAVALSDSFFPVIYLEPEEEEPAVFSLRIEGPGGTICDASVEGITALDIVERGADICGYAYHIQQTDFGPYLDMVDGVEADGPAGWLYWVNWQAAEVGAADYRLSEGDRVLWSYGQWGIQPMRLGVSQGQIDPEEEVTVTVEYFNGTGWLAVNEAWVRAGAENYRTNENGQAAFSFEQAGIYEIYAEKDNFIRTNREDVKVGSGAQQAVGLSVVVDNGPGDIGQEDTLSFVVDVANLDFGTLAPGQSASRQVRVSNNGQVMVYLEGIVSGDVLFENNLQINQADWENYQSAIASGSFTDLSVGLQIPQNYALGGQKSADLIFWGTRQ